MHEPLSSPLANESVLYPLSETSRRSPRPCIIFVISFYLTHSLPPSSVISHYTRAAHNAFPVFFLNIFSYVGNFTNSRSRQNNGDDVEADGTPLLSLYHHLLVEDPAKCP